MIRRSERKFALGIEYSTVDLTGLLGLDDPDSVVSKPVGSPIEVSTWLILCVKASESGYLSGKAEEPESGLSVTDAFVLIKEYSVEILVNCFESTMAVFSL